MQEEATGGPQGRVSRQQGESLDVILQVAAHLEPNTSPVESSGNSPFRKWKTVCGLLRKMSDWDSQELLTLDLDFATWPRFWHLTSIITPLPHSEQANLHVHPKHEILPHGEGHSWKESQGRGNSPQKIISENNRAKWILQIDTKDPKIHEDEMQPRKRRARARELTWEERRWEGNESRSQKPPVIHPTQQTPSN